MGKKKKNQPLTFHFASSTCAANKPWEPSIFNASAPHCFIFQTLISLNILSSAGERFPPDCWALAVPAELAVCGSIMSTSSRRAEASQDADGAEGGSGQLGEAEHLSAETKAQRLFCDYVSGDYSFMFMEPRLNSEERVLQDDGGEKENLRREL